VKLRRIGIRRYEAAAEFGVVGLLVKIRRIGVRRYVAEFFQTSIKAAPIDPVCNMLRAYKM